MTYASIATDEYVDRNRILEAVCIEFECTLEQLTGHSRMTHLVNARMACSFLLTKRLNHTKQFIADTLKKDRTTIINLLEREQSFRFIKDAVINRIDRIEEKLFKQTI
jgi:chromosomal replication initiation ATPase DnaA